MSTEQLIKRVKELVETDLKPIVNEVDTQGFYPEKFLHELGNIGGFSALGTMEEGGSGLGFATQIKVIHEVGKVCGATAFLVWCQTVCAWYLHQSKRKLVRQKYLANVLNGHVLAGTGMSNTVKHLSKLENNFLQAKKTAKGYIVNGTLPWVSNIGETHIWASTAQVENEGYIMFIVSGEQSGISLKKCPPFCALEGTRTLSVNFNNVLIEEENLLADVDEYEHYLNSIRSGFILLQIGMGSGIIEDCLNIIKKSNAKTHSINHHLEDDFDVLTEHFSKILQQTLLIADSLDNKKANYLSVLKIRLAAAKLGLLAAQSAALHAGAKGYLMSHPAQRRSREAMFVAIVTPSIKHLTKDIAQLESN